MDSEKLRKRKYPTALALAKGEEVELPEMYEYGKTVKEIAEYYSTTVSTVIKALVFLGYEGPTWAKDAVKRTLDRTNVKPSNMKRIGKSLI